MPIAAAIPSIIGLGTSLIGGAIGSSSSTNAAKQAATVDAAAGKGLETLSADQVQASQDRLNPYLAAGQQGANQLSTALAPGGDLTKQFSFDPSQIANNPNYQFVLQQGTDAVQKSAAAKGGLFSGGTMKALDQYSQGLATQTINDAYSQALNTFQTNRNNMFQGYTTEAQTGLSAAQLMQQAQQTQLQGNIAGANAYMSGGNTTANGTLSAGNAWQNALQGATGPLINLASTIPGASVSPAPPGNYQTLPSYTSQPPVPPPPIVNPVPVSGYGGGY